MGQLCFALRLAGYRSFAREPGPLPIILDDIMDTFDDPRARAALQLCAEIGVNLDAFIASTPSPSQESNSRKL
jgi:chromosome segregation protein